MSSPTTSLVPVSKTKVAAAGRALVARMERQQKACFDEEVAEVAKNDKVLLPTPWYIYQRSRPITQQEAEAKVKGNELDSGGYIRFWWSISGSAWMDKGKCFVTAAELAEGDVVWLNLEDAATVKEYAP